MGTVKVVETRLWTLVILVAVLVLVACKSRDPFDRRLDELGAIKTFACACNDKRCADEAGVKATQWATDLLGDKHSNEPLSKEQLNRSDRLQSEIDGCRAKALASRTPSQSSDPSSGFYCERIAGPSGLRSCHRNEKYCPSDCFRRETANCYVRSMWGENGWLDEKSGSCFATPEECKKDHDSTGPAGPPPYQTECHVMHADEVP